MADDPSDVAARRAAEPTLVRIRRLEQRISDARKIARESRE